MHEFFKQSIPCRTVGILSLQYGLMFTTIGAQDIWVQIFMIIWRTRIWWTCSNGWQHRIKSANSRLCGRCLIGWLQSMPEMMQIHRQPDHSLIGFAMSLNRNGLYCTTQMVEDMAYSQQTTLSCTIWLCMEWDHSASWHSGIHSLRLCKVLQRSLHGC